MQSNRVEGQVPTATHLPQPRGNARWRWSSSTSRKAAMAGGAMAAVLGLGAGVAGAAPLSAATALVSGVSVDTMISSSGADLPV